MPKRTDINKILIIGSGPIIIGQACEFDYSGTQACKALRKLGYEIVLVNSNPATIMTDPETADVTYIEPLNAERLEQIIAKERPDALLPNLGGQSGLNLCAELAKNGILDKYNVQVIGVQVDAIERGEDRIEFKKSMDAIGIEMARSQVAYSVEEALDIAVEDAKLDEKDVKRSRVELDYDDGKLTYDVEFYTDSEEYDYEIDAKTGKILSADREIERDFRDIDPEAEAQYTEEEALEIAREDAQLEEKDIEKSRVKLERDDGFLIYNVEFYVGNEEYDYEIDADTGRIMDVDYEIEDDFLSEDTEGVEISEAEAEEIALEMVPGASSEDLHMKLERDDGRRIYEGDIRYDGMEYEFEINAENGKIISWESESEWDD